MSTYETKYGIRVKIPELNNASDEEVNSYFVNKGLTPNTEHKKCTGFGSDKVRDYSVVTDYNGIWGVEYLFVYEWDTIGEAEMNEPIGEIYKASMKMAEKFDVELENVSVFAYTWYNGSEEPLSFK